MSGPARGNGRKYRHVAANVAVFVFALLTFAVILGVLVQNFTGLD